MADISALSKISERMRIHQRLVNSTDSSTTDLLAFSKEVSSATKESTDCVKDVAKYATRINEDLAKLRQLIKDFTIQIGDKMKALAEAGLFKGKTKIKKKPYDLLFLGSKKTYLNLIYVVHFLLISDISDPPYSG